jgi:hypothetical protein
MTLTRESLLKLKPEVEKITIKGFGDAYIKNQSELQRSKRMAQLFDKNGKPDFKEQMRSRVYSIVDQLCGKDGAPLFTEGDIKEIMALDSTQLDAVCDAIAEWNDSKLEKNDKGE